MNKNKYGIIEKYKSVVKKEFNVGIASFTPIRWNDRNTLEELIRKDPLLEKITTIKEKTNEGTVLEVQIYRRKNHPREFVGVYIQPDGTISIETNSFGFSHYLYDCGYIGVSQSQEPGDINIKEWIPRPKYKDISQKIIPKDGNKK